jgi:hypothetical protein
MAMADAISPPIREQALQIARSLPQDASWDDLMYRIYVRKAIERGLSDSDADRVVDSSDARSQLGLSSND